MVDSEGLQVNSPAAQTHLTIMQGVIGRMGENSNRCKFQCVILVGAALVFLTQADESSLTLIALIPVILFSVLDAYYLALERAFRDSYNNFVGKLHRRALAGSDLYTVEPTGMGVRRVAGTALSKSILAFYLPALSIVAATWALVNL